MAIANVEMAAAWDGAEGEHWTEHADRYESMGPAYGDALVAAVGLGADDDVVDIGCGTGRSTRDAARVARSGTALGVDLSGQMLERARRVAAAEGLTNVRFEQGDVQVHPFPAAAFDVAISSFGAMFFADPVAAFSNVAQAMRPAGRLGLLGWRGLGENEWLCALRGALAAGRSLPTPPAGLPGPFGLADPTRTAAVLEESGFADVGIEPFDAPMRFGTDAGDAFAFVSTLGMTRGLLEGVDAGAAAGVLDALRAVLADHDGPDGVLLGSAAWLITARRT